ncbi:hypothetical protein HL670_01713 [Serratia plymuthica]|nr:hypothetical protein HL670_01713 [Serratia plymuthica]
MMFIWLELKPCRQRLSDDDRLKSFISRAEVAASLLPLLIYQFCFVGDTIRSLTVTFLGWLRA